MRLPYPSAPRRGSLTIAYREGGVGRGYGFRSLRLSDRHEIYHDDLFSLLFLYFKLHGFGVHDIDRSYRMDKGPVDITCGLDNERRPRSVDALADGVIRGREILVN